MQQLHRRYPPRAAEPSWRVTRQDGDLLLARMLELPFTGKDQRVRRRRGLVSVIEWLAAHPGQTWQERWQATGAGALATPGGGGHPWTGCRPAACGTGRQCR